MIKSKKAALIENEVVEIAAAIFAIGILVAFAVLLYSAVTKNQEKQQAQVQINDIASKIVKVQKDGITMSHLYTNPKAWYLVYYDIGKINSNPSLNKIPALCKYKSCICLCSSNFKASSIEDIYKRENAEICNLGACANTEGVSEIILQIKTVPVTLEIKKEGLISINFKNAV